MHKTEFNDKFYGGGGLSLVSEGYVLVLLYYNGMYLVFYPFYSRWHEITKDFGFVSALKPCGRTVFSCSFVKPKCHCQCLNCFLYSVG